MILKKRGYPYIRLMDDQFEIRRDKSFGLITIKYSDVKSFWYLKRKGKVKKFVDVVFLGKYVPTYTFIITFKGGEKKTYDCRYLKSEKFSKFVSEMRERL